MHQVAELRNVPVENVCEGLRVKSYDCTAKTVWHVSCHTPPPPTNSSWRTSRARFLWKWGACFYVGISAKLETLNNITGPIRSATGGAGSAPKRELTTTQGKVGLLGMCCRLKSVAVRDE